MQGEEVCWPKACGVAATSARRGHDPGQFLIVTFDGGGAVPPALGLGRGLIARGHSVRVLAPRTLRQRIETARCTFRPFPAALEWDATKGRDYGDQPEPFRALLCGPSLAEAVLAEVRRAPADVLIVDSMLRNALSAAEATGSPMSVLVHAQYSFFAFARDPARQWWDLDLVNETRGRLRLPPLAKGEDRVNIQLWKRCDRIFSVLPREFEDFDGVPPAVKHVGPIFEGNEGEAAWDLPWPPEHPDPLIVASFSSTYMHHETALGRVLAALGPLRARVLLTLGGGLEPHEVPAPSGVVVRRYVPHPMVLPHASLVVTHAGIGTVMAAFASGVPMLCMPLGRDQPGNAARVEALGAGRTIAPDAREEDVRNAVVEILGSDPLRAGAQRMAAIVAGYGGVNLAITELESLLPASRSA